MQGSSPQSTDSYPILQLTELRGKFSNFIQIKTNKGKSFLLF